MSSSVLHGFAAHRFRATSARFSRMRTTSAMRCLCMALRSEHCQLTTLKLTKCQMRSEEARSLAAAVKACSVQGPLMQTLVLEGSSLPVPQLLGIRELSQVSAQKLDRMLLPTRRR